MVAQDEWDAYLDSTRSARRKLWISFAAASFVIGVIVGTAWSKVIGSLLIFVLWWVAFAWFQRHVRANAITRFPELGDPSIKWAPTYTFSDEPRPTLDDSA